MKNSITLLDPVALDSVGGANHIPITIRQALKGNKWLDSILVESLFKVLDLLWPESLIGFSAQQQPGNAELIKMEKKIAHLLDFSNSEEL